jgi:tetratricopeptide (TPR) repeat protein
MEENLAQNAISFALQCNWKEAIKVNLQILKDEKDDVEALNRLAHAYFASGDTAKAKSTSQKVLKISSDDSIAIKALEKYKQGKKSGGGTVEIGNNASLFIEEPGKTKITTLINLAPEKVYSFLNSGEEVLLAPYSHKVSVTTLKGAYIGKLTDDLSARVRKLVKGGNKYKVLIKSANKNCVKVFIKEEKRGKELENVQSFPREKSESLGEFST